ncbi:hypothetical protein OG333_38600 (plasmid) [Streptomyces anulatus]|uniref:hypothetical protein n=1 Tax=Streptomyces anulatus TaxID=1892 RepID=UPI0037DD4609|nr:hypothetical protein OG333_38600 [Streptomyces anulatus]
MRKIISAGRVPSLHAFNEFLEDVNASAAFKERLRQLRVAARDETSGERVVGRVKGPSGASSADRASGRMRGSNSGDQIMAMHGNQAPPPVLSGRAGTFAEPVSSLGQPDPLRVTGVKDLVEALRAVHIWAGSPSLRALEARSNGRLRRSTVSDMLKKEALPDYDRYVSFLRACGIDGSRMSEWLFTWRSLKAREHPDAAAWLRGLA